VYQLGRGSEPVMVVGSTMSLVARYIGNSSLRSDFYAGRIGERQNELNSDNAYCPT
jgi:hypothetical protein